MSGRIIVSSNNNLLKIKHTHLSISLSNNLIVKFIDPRRFGFIVLLSSNNILSHKFFIHLGPEPLSKKFNSNYLMRSCHKKKASIKSIIMNQSMVVGVGNIYASEALHISTVSPMRQAHTITHEEFKRIVFLMVLDKVSILLAYSNLTPSILVVIGCMELLFERGL